MKLFPLSLTITCSTFSQFRPTSNNTKPSLFTYNTHTQTTFYQKIQSRTEQIFFLDETEQMFSHGCRNQSWLFITSEVAAMSLSPALFISRKSRAFNKIPDHKNQYQSIKIKNWSTKRERKEKNIPSREVGSKWVSCKARGWQVKEKRGLFEGVLCWQFSLLLGLFLCSMLLSLFALVRFLLHPFLVVSLVLWLSINSKWDFAPPSFFSLHIKK